MEIGEFFGGLGGWHVAFESSKIGKSDLWSYEISPNANLTYLSNFSKLPNCINLANINIEEFNKRNF